MRDFLGKEGGSTCEKCDSFVMLARSLSRSVVRLSGPCLAVALMSFVGCGDNVRAVTPLDPTPQPPAASSWPVLEGQYDIETDIALPATVLAPAAVAGLFEDLRATRDNPAGTWFTLLKQAGLSQAEKLVEALPSVLADRLKGWINKTLAAQFQPGEAKRAELDAIIDEASALLTRFDVLTTLAVPPSTAASAPAPASHAFAAFRFKLIGQNVQVPSIWHRFCERV